MCLSVDTPDEPDKSLPEDDLQKNLAFLLDRVEGCSVRYLSVAAFDLFLFVFLQQARYDGTGWVCVAKRR